MILSSLELSLSFWLTDLLLSLLREGLLEFLVLEEFTKGFL